MTVSAIDGAVHVLMRSLRDIRTATRSGRLLPPNEMRTVDYLVTLPVAGWLLRDMDLPLLGWRELFLGASGSLYQLDSATGRYQNCIVLFNGSPELSFIDGRLPHHDMAYISDRIEELLHA